MQAFARTYLLLSHILRIWLSERRPHSLSVKHMVNCTSHILVVPTPEAGKSKLGTVKGRAELFMVASASHPLVHVCVVNCLLTFNKFSLKFNCRNLWASELSETNS